MEKLRTLANDYFYPENLTEEQEIEEENRFDGLTTADIAIESFKDGFKKCLEIVSPMINDIDMNHISQIEGYEDHFDQLKKFLDFYSKENIDKI